MRKGKIITVGISPAWDIHCIVDGIDWGEHKVIDSQTQLPAGKALNVSKSLAYVGYISIASGLWGEYDYDDMITKLKPFNAFIDLHFTVVNGKTRQNTCINDTRNNRQMHLRLPGTLASKANIKKLSGQLSHLVEKGDLCVFAGSIPQGNFTDEIVSMVWDCKDREADIVLDSSGPTFERLVDTEQISIISPNITELEELIDTRLKPEPYVVARAGKKLLKKVEMILVSMGAQGAVLIRREGYWYSEPVGVPMPVVKTVGSGDNLLAGFIAGLHEDDDPGYALAKAVRLATAFSYGLCDTLEEWELAEKVNVETSFHQF